MTIDLSGSVVLVTGASRGIGAAIAKGLANCGATVAVHYFNNEKLAKCIAKELGNDSEAFGADLSSPIATKKLFKSVLRRYGRIDVLINNAAIAISSPLNSENWQGDWDETMAVNLRAVAILSKMAIEKFKEQGGGRIINVASRAAFRGDTTEYMAYAASKGGVLNLTKSIAKNFGKDGIKCFALAPGFVNTDMAKPFIEQYGEDFTTSDLALNDKTQPTDVAGFAVFLASGLGDHATGTSIDINAGSYLH